MIDEDEDIVLLTDLTAKGADDIPVPFPP